MAYPDIGERTVEVTRIRSQGITRSPFTKKQKVHDWANSVWHISVTTARYHIDSNEADVWTQFFIDTDGANNTFTVNMDNLVPGQSLGNLTFKMDSPNDKWTIDEEQHVAFSFEATEDV